MSHEYASPSSLHLELEARRMHAPSRAAGLADTAPGLILSGFPQAFDLAIGAMAAVLVFPAAAFSGLDRTTGVLAGLAVWVAAYAVSPLGARLFDEVRRRHGRGVELTASRFLLGAFTAAVAFLPMSLGATTVVVLAGSRILQGVAMGGVANGAALRRAFAAESGRTGAAVIRGFAALTGVAVACGLFAVLHGVLGRGDFLDWGWRYPFILGVPLNIVALFADLRLLAAEGREKAGRQEVARLATVSGAPVEPKA
jgi:MFS family permease